MCSRRTAQPNRPSALPIGPEPAAQDLARVGVQRIERHLRPVHIKPGEDRHQGPPLEL
jgi:hypothetical protein